MTGTFASFNTALSALRYNRVAMDVASSNIANSSSTGYTRRRVEGEAVGAPAQPAMWSRFQGGGEGVRVASLHRMADSFLDARSRTEHGALSYLTTKQAVLERFESGVGEPGDNGVAAALSQFRAGWHDLANAPSGEAARSQVLSRAASLVDTIRIQSRNVTEESAAQQTRLDSVMEEVSTLTGDLAQTNLSIAVGTFNGTDVNALLDQRDLLALRLSQLTGASATQRADGGLDVTVGGVSLVQGGTAGTLAATRSGTGAVVFTVTSQDGTSAAVSGLRGEAGAIADLVGVTLPAYTAGLDAVARQVADEVNALHVQGWDQRGNPGGPLFAYDPARPAASLAVVITDPAAVAAAGVPGVTRDGSHATAMAGATTAADAYQRLVNGLGNEVASVKRLAANQAGLTAQIDGNREQLSGVSLDEEMVTLLASQRAYEAASRVMNTVDEMLDTLINRTGLVGR